MGGGWKFIEEGAFKKDQENLQVEQNNKKIKKKPKAKKTYEQ
jgi:hypothetical protein